jgi:uncharacterized membrane protein YhaH (DUF805 family)
MLSYGRYGRINRASYWLALALFVSAFIALSLLTARPPHVAEVVLIIFATPRLHDIGLSGWWAGGVFLTEIAMVVIAIVTLPVDAAMTIFGVFALLVIGLLIWLGAVAGDPNPNRYGDPPTRGISMYPWEKKSV